MISPVPESILDTLTSQVDDTRFEDIQDVFPQSDNKLGFFQAVRSPVVDIKALNRNDSLPYRFPIILSLKADLPKNTNKSVDYCLGRANIETNELTCVERRILQNNDESNEFSYEVKENGIYTILYNPQPVNLIVNPEECDWICSNKGAFIGFIICAVVVFILAIIGIWRLSKYVGKY